MLEPQISLTPAALTHVKKYLHEHQLSGGGVRFGVKMTGCSGYSYVVDYAEQPTDREVVIAIDAEVNVFIARENLPILNGSIVDYVRQGFNERFVFQNPNEAGACGCGESFTV